MPNTNEQLKFSDVLLKLTDYFKKYPRVFFTDYAKRIGGGLYCIEEVYLKQTTAVYTTETFEKYEPDNGGWACSTFQSKYYPKEEESFSLVGICGHSEEVLFNFAANPLSSDNYQFSISIVEGNPTVMFLRDNELAYKISFLPKTNDTK